MTAEELSEEINIATEPMRHVHVCLVSEQTIPNILGLYHFKPDMVVFCTTEKMEKEKRVESIVDTLIHYGLDYTKLSERVLVDQDCLEDCETKLKIEIARKYENDKLVINLTGGTKIMVLAAYNVFNNIAEQMIYTPIPKNEFMIVSPKEGNCKSLLSLNLRLSVESYVTAYGVKVKNKSKIEQLKTAAKRNEELCTWMVENYREIEDLLGELYKNLKDYRDKRDIRLQMNYMPRNQKEREFLKRVGFSEGHIDKTLLKHEVKFLTGDWLSDSCFNVISKLPVDDCVTGIELISSMGPDNEFDVMFTKDNALYIIECKSLKQKHDKGTGILYKINSLQHDFGLRVKGFLVSTARNILDESNNISNNILRRATQCNTEVIHPDKINSLGEWIKKHIKGLF